MVKYTYKKPEQDTPFVVEFIAWHTSDEWIKNNIHVGDFVKLRSVCDDAVEIDEIAPIYLYFKGRRCGVVESYADRCYLDMFLGFEKIGKVTETRYDCNYSAIITASQENGHAQSAFLSTRTAIV